MAIKLGIVGIGKIARDQHLPSLAASQDFELVAAASRHARLDEAPTLATLAEMLDRFPQIEAVSLCAPPMGRIDDARLALSRGLHVMLEKPPAATLSDAQDLIDLAREAGRSLFFTWHSRYAPGVAAARDWLKSRTIRKVSCHWLEDIRVWHPGQEWILQPGGFGVFDPAINALSILTAILPRPFALRTARLVFPGNRQGPIAANLALRDRAGAEIGMELDFLYPGEPRWDIEVETDDGMLQLRKGGGELSIDGAAVETPGEALLQGEYPNLYRRFAELVRSGASDTDIAPLRHVADAFLLGERTQGPPFAF